ncbi:MAG: hypothetical protein AB7S26_06190 [Sandaracinaceae bacterium]
MSPIDGSVQVLGTKDEIRSLTWDGDHLVDWVSGEHRYGLDGSHQRAHVFYAYRFDAAVATPDGSVAVIYERGGTKGLVLQRGKLVREIDRSYYFANAYEYPICLWTREGRVLLAHCPTDYHRLHVEDALTGDRLTARPEEPQPEDFFQSRLEVSPGGKRLLSAGWVWHPWSAVALYDVDAALRDPTTLDRASFCAAAPGEAIQEASATWQSDDRIIVTADADTGDPERGESGQDELRLEPNGVIVYDVRQARCVSACRLEQPAGLVMRVGEGHVLALYQHPRLVQLSDGAVVHAWPDVPTGTQTSSITRGVSSLPPAMALDPDRRRIAVAREREIVVISLAPFL